MITLEEHNRTRGVFHKNCIDHNGMPHPNNIACPECGEGLWDTSPMLTLTSQPPQKNVNCHACGYKGYRIL